MVATLTTVLAYAALLRAALPTQAVTSKPNVLNASTNVFDKLVAQFARRYGQPRRRQS